MSEDEFYAATLPWIEKGINGNNYDKRELARLMRTRVDILSEIPEKLAFLSDFKAYDLAMYEHKKMKVDAAVALRAVGAALDILKSLDDWSEEGIKQAISENAEKYSLKGGQIMFSMRVALTGAAVTPGGAIEMAIVLGREESLKRLEFSEKLLEDAQA